MEETGNNEVLTLPMVALRNMVVMPGMMIHFDVRRKFSVAAVENAMRRHRADLSPKPGKLVGG